MAPEQAAGQATGRRQIGMRVGIMAYEALTGARPFDGDPWQVMRDKQARDAPRLTAALGLPGDLADLTNRLISREPGVQAGPARDRGGPCHVHRAGGGLAGQPPVIWSDALATGGPGRRPGDPHAVTGAGDGLRPGEVRGGEDKPGRGVPGPTPRGPVCRHPRRPMLRPGVGPFQGPGRPHRRADHVPPLTPRGRGRPPAPRRHRPAGGGVPGAAALRRRGPGSAGRLDALDQQQIRQRAFAALRLLLDRVAGRTSLVCFIDDLQWGDADSAAAIFEVLRPPASPALLFVGSYRSDEADSSPFLAEWSSLLRRNGVDFGDRVVTVGPLSLREATQLVASVVGRDNEVVGGGRCSSTPSPGGTHSCSWSWPGASTRTPTRSERPTSMGCWPRSWARCRRGPCSSSTQSRCRARRWSWARRRAAAGLAEPEGALNQLRTARLLRVVGAKVDTYHDRIRYAVLDRMPDGPRRDMHRRLAEVIERSGRGTPGQDLEAIADGKAEPGGRAALARVYDLSYHYDAAGDNRHALAYALVAAAQARTQFALDVAAQQYAVAERNADGDAR